uniref:Uncharacterized protein n=1 Tax=Arundo donax TaxID=35708 RepID=A0A0A9AV54_ARUDO
MKISEELALSRKILNIRLSQTVFHD